MERIECVLSGWWVFLLPTDPTGTGRVLTGWGPRGGAEDLGAAAGGDRPLWPEQATTESQAGRRGSHCDVPLGPVPLGQDSTGYETSARYHQRPSLPAREGCAGLGQLRPCSLPPVPLQPPHTTSCCPPGCPAGHTPVQTPAPF